jgi:hypothetical protein
MERIGLVKFETWKFIFFSIKKVRSTPNTTPFSHRGWPRNLKQKPIRSAQTRGRGRGVNKYGAAQILGRNRNSSSDEHNYNSNTDSTSSKENKHNNSENPEEKSQS